MVSRRGVCGVVGIPGALALSLLGCDARTSASPDGGSPPDHPVAAEDHAAPPAPVPLDVLTHHNNAARSGANQLETVLTTGNVAPATFGKLFSLNVDGAIWAQPLYVSSFRVNGANHNVLIVATAHNGVFAFDADTAGPPLWQTSLGPSVPSSAVRMKQLGSEIGIVSTPVVSLDPDRDSGVVYLTTANYYDNTPSFSVHALNLATGAESPGQPDRHRRERARHGVLDGQVHGEHAGTAAGAPAGGRHRLHRVCLLRDLPTYHGSILGYRYDASTQTLKQTAVFNTTPDGTSGGIWQSGQGLVADGKGYIYALTGNGTTSVQEGGHSYSEAFLKLDQSLTVQDYFIPYNYAALTAGDYDVGSSGPLLVPGTTLIAGGGKEGIVYSVDTTNMGHVHADANQVVQAFSVGSTIQAAPVVWTGGGPTRLYVWTDASSLQGYTFTDGYFDGTPFATGGQMLPKDSCGNLSVSSNGTLAGTGIVWANTPLADASFATVSGVLFAFDALTLEFLWSSNASGTRDTLGSYSKFVPPTVIDGKVYAATASLQVVVYGLLPG